MEAFNLIYALVVFLTYIGGVIIGTLSIPELKTGRKYIKLLSNILTALALFFLLEMITTSLVAVIIGLAVLLVGILHSLSKNHDHTYYNVGNYVHTIVIIVIIVMHVSYLSTLGQTLSGISLLLLATLDVYNNKKSNKISVKSLKMKFFVCKAIIILVLTAVLILIL